MPEPGPPADAAAPRATHTNPAAVISLLFALLWGYGLLSLVAVVVGAAALATIGETGQRGRGLAIAGVILGTLGVLGGIVYVAVTFVENFIEDFPGRCL